jgi:hypothetical protein
MIIISRHLLLLLCLYIEYIIVLDIYYNCVNIFGTIKNKKIKIKIIKENMMCQDFNGKFNVI